jgi:hypothetical protein
MKKEQVDIANRVVLIEDSKTPTEVSEVPLTEIATKAFHDQLALAGPSPWLFQVLAVSVGIRSILRSRGNEPFAALVCLIFAIRPALDVCNSTKR